MLSFMSLYVYKTGEVPADFQHVTLPSPNTCFFSPIIPSVPKEEPQQQQRRQ
jgi:hypothetical protein